MNVEERIPSPGRQGAHHALDLDDPEVRLELNREALRERLIEAREHPGPLTRAAETATPWARQMVREHPYASLAAAALAGMWLVRMRPWRGLARPLLRNVLNQGAMALTLWGANRLMGHTPTYRDAPGRPPQP